MDIRIDIINKIVRNGDVVGYIIQDGGFTLAMPTRGLYSETYFHGLISNGYKVYDYAGKICDASGKFIVDLPPVDFSEIDKNEWISGEEFAACALTDAEVSKYYAFEEIAGIEFKTGNYEIHTRAELLAYLNKVSYELSSTGFVTDHRPLNYFVAPEARFKIEELIESSELVKYIHIINARRTFRDYIDYMGLVKFLKAQGTLQNDKPSEAEFLQAYYAWGPEGINAKCVGNKFRLAVDGSFDTIDDRLEGSDPVAFTLAARQFSIPFIQDNNMNIRHLRYTTNLRTITELADFGRANLAFTSDDMIMTRKRLTDREYMYTGALNGVLAVPTDRLYYTLRSDDGFTYIYKVAHNATMLITQSGRKLIFIDKTNVRFLTQLGNFHLCLNEVRNQEDYIMWNLCAIRAAELLKERKVTPIKRSSYELLTSLGMTPISAVRYMAAHTISLKEHQSNVNNLKKYPGLRTDPTSFFSDSIPKDILEAFMLDDGDINTTEDFLEMAQPDDLLGRRMEIDNNELTPGMEGYDYTYISDPKVRAHREAFLEVPSDAISYYYNLKFVHDCISGIINIDNFGDGIEEDGVSSLQKAATLFMSVIYEYKGDYPTIEEANEVLNNLSSSRLMNIDKVFKVRDKASKGCIMDLANAAEKIAHKDHNWYWMYVNKVFSELNNKPSGKARPYLLEVITIGNNSKHQKLDTQLREICCAYAEDALSKVELEDEGVIWKLGTSADEVRMTYRQALGKFRDLLASELLFKIIGAKYEGSGTLNITLKIPMTGQDIVIPVDEQVVQLLKSLCKNQPEHVRYISIYDYIYQEYNHISMEGGSFRFHVVNAEVGIWDVKPKKGYQFKMLSLAPSYYRSNDINTIGGENFREGLVKSGSASTTALMDVLGVNGGFICDGDDVYSNSRESSMFEMDYTRSAKTLSELSVYDKAEQLDYIFVYMKRWSLLNKEAKERNLICEHMPMKQDIVWGQLAPYFNMEVPSNEPIFRQGVNNSLTNADVTVFKYDPSLALETYNTGKTISIASPADVGLIAFVKLYAEKILQGHLVAVVDNWIFTKEGDKYLVPKMTDSDVYTLQNTYGVRIGNTIFLATAKGIYKVEV